MANAETEARMAADKQNEYARELVARLGSAIGDELAQALLNADQTAEQGVRHSAIGFAITQSNENARRQEIFDACVQAGGN